MEKILVGKVDGKGQYIVKTIFKTRVSNVSFFSAPLETFYFFRWFLIYESGDIFAVDDQPRMSISPVGSLSCFISILPYNS